MHTLGRMGQNVLESSAAIEQLRDTLLPPLQFARRNHYACLERLIGLQQLVHAALKRLAKDLPNPLLQQLHELSKNFDTLGNSHKRQRVDKMLALLKETSQVQLEQKRVVPASPLFGNPLSWKLSCLQEEIPQDTLKALAEEGIVTLRDVLHVLPREYAHCCLVQQQKDLRSNGLCSVYGKVAHVQRVAGKRPRLQVALQGTCGALQLTFFHFFPKDNRFQVGRAITAAGVANRFQGQWQMVHPRILFGDRRQELDKVQVTYPTCAGLSSVQWQKLQQHVLAFVSKHSVADPVTKSLQLRHCLADLQKTYTYVHNPPHDMTAQQWKNLHGKQTPQHRRVAFEELLGLQITLGRMAGQTSETQGEVQRAVALPPIKQGARGLYETFFPYKPTSCQQKALTEITSDLCKSTPMTRLLHGDVGAGKTAVAAAACLHCVQQKLQCAVMAPTEVLAQQHAKRLTQLLAPLGVCVVLLTGQVKGKIRRERTLQLNTGAAHIAVGTHALLSEDVEFAQLGLCVIDEQHRFGVAHRSRLRQKGAKSDHVPHLLVMTATPIPRSLALTLYGNMSISTLRHLPEGRKRISTRVVRGDPAEQVPQLARWIDEHHGQTYVVYPVIEESEKLDLHGAKQGYEALCQQLGEQHVVLLHGRMTSVQKQEAMDVFSSGAVRVLVSTTVVEVGVDVPNASCMIVMHAQRFGLSQLHQLRGRVGRGTTASECILVAPVGLGETAYKRLRVLTKSNDGFHIAQADLMARGPGDFLGKRQSGAPLFRFCNLIAHADLIEPSRRLAQEILRRDPALANEAHTPYRQACAWQTLS